MTEQDARTHPELETEEENASGTSPSERSKKAEGGSSTDKKVRIIVLSYVLYLNRIILALKYTYYISLCLILIYRMINSTSLRRREM